jgi:uncharacterized membrane protein
MVFRADVLQNRHGRLSMNRDTPREERLVALTLKIGAYSAFACIVVGLVLHYAASFGNGVTAAGMIVLLATPVLRIIVAGAQFLRERDLHYVFVSLGVLGIVLLAYWLGV